MTQLLERCSFVVIEKPQGSLRLRAMRRMHYSRETFLPRVRSWSRVLGFGVCCCKGNGSTSRDCQNIQHVLLCMMLVKLTVVYLLARSNSSYATISPFQLSRRLRYEKFCCLAAGCRFRRQGKKGEIPPEIFLSSMEAFGAALQRIAG